MGISFLNFLFLGGLIFFANPHCFRFLIFKFLFFGGFDLFLFADPHYFRFLIFSFYFLEGLIFFFLLIPTTFAF
ncbi:hypothetical protein DEE33_06515 [Helicobacter pylori]|nr:hypothetical protein DEE33_06515 [Helicobacter pylori]